MKRVISIRQIWEDKFTDDAGHHFYTIDGEKVERNFQPYVFEPIPTWERPKRDISQLMQNLLSVCLE